MLLSAYQSPLLTSLQRPFNYLKLPLIEQFLPLYQQAVVLYSLRKLTPQATKAIRVRRDSDNVEQDIGFVGKDLDQQVIEDFGGYNLLGYTQDLTHSSWLKENYGSSGQIPVITPNVFANPLDGQQTAARIDFNAADGNGISAIRQITPYFQGEQLVEIYLRTIPGSGTKTLRMRMDSSQGAISKNFNVTETWTKHFINVASNRTDVRGWSLRLRPLTGTSTTASVYAYAPQWVQGSTSLPYQPRSQGGASDCFIVKWYDQINNNDSVQNNIALQPKIYNVASGEIIKQNGKPAILFDGIDNSLVIPNSTSLLTGLHKHNEFGELFGLFASGTVQNTNNAYIFSNSTGAGSIGYSTVYRGSGNSFIRSLVLRGVGGTNAMATNDFTPNDGLQRLYNVSVGDTFSEKTNDVNGRTNVSYNNPRSSSNASYDFRIGANGVNIDNFKGAIQELIIFNKNLTAQENINLHNDINTYYGIY